MNKSNRTYKIWLMLLVQIMVITSSEREEQDEDDVELWLEDYTRAKVSGGIQSDSPQGPDEEEIFEKVCPLIPTPESPTLPCLLPKCDNDLDCLWPRQKCCHNGCLHTCMDGLTGSLYVDWRREPKRNILTGISWLIKDENEVNSKSRYLADTCTVDDQIYRDGQKFSHHNHKCKCQKGIVDCDVKKELHP